MRGLTRRCLMLVLAGGVGVGLFRPDWVTAAGLDVWHLPALRAEIAEAERTRAELDDLGDLFDHRIEVKDEMIRELNAGRLTLEQTTDRFLAMNKDVPETMTAIRYAFPSHDDREATARNVLAFAELARFPSPAAKAATLRRLDDEFARLFPAVAD